MILEEWVEKLNGMKWSKSDIKLAQDIWNASREDLPRCDSCSYYEKASDIETYWHECQNPKIDIKRWNYDEGLSETVTPLVTRDFGCILHSELEK